MKRLLPVPLSVAGLLVLALLGLLIKAVLGRYVVVFLLGVFGLSFIVALVAFLLVIFTVSPVTGQKD